ncbi:MAG: Wzz/FepE/Etk N-terminal domain-containing protein [Bacteroidales bacterium]
MDLVEFIGVIKRWIILVIAVAVVVTGYTAFVALRTPASYSADTTVIIGLSEITSSSLLGISITQNAERLTSTYAELVTTQPVMEKSLEKAGLDWPITELQSMVFTTTTKNTPSLQISVIDSDANRATLLANTVSEAFVEYIKETGKNSALEAQAETMKQLNDVNKEIAALGATSSMDAGLFKALQDRRDTIINEYEILLNQQAHAGDVRVIDSAYTVTRAGMSNTQKIGISFVISLVAGIVLAFIAEAVRKSFRETPVEQF